MNNSPTIIQPAPTPIIPVEEEEEVTQEKFNEMMDAWIAEQAQKEPGSWSAEAREWAENAGLIAGDTNGKKMYKKNLTREELVTVLYRALHRYFV
jgi:poly(3-hydroxyalkanoate) synthetase